MHRQQSDKKLWQLIRRLKLSWALALLALFCSSFVLLGCLVAYQDDYYFRMVPRWLKGLVSLLEFFSGAPLWLRAAIYLLVFWLLIFVVFTLADNLLRDLQSRTNAAREAKTPAATPAAAPAATPAEAPAEASAATLAAAPAETPAETSTATPAATPTEASAATPAATPADSQSRESQERWQTMWSKTKHLFFQKRPFLAPFLLLLLCWLPHLIATYPGTMDPVDVLDQLTQYHGVAFRTSTWINLINPDILLNNNNPVFHTVLLNLCVDAGTALGHQNLGFFSFTLMQFLLFAGAIAYGIRSLQWLQTPIALRISILLGFCFIPLFPLWAIAVTKDVPFTALILLYLVFLIRLVVRSEDFDKYKRLYPTFFVICLFAMLVRNNGLHVILLTTPFLLLLPRKSAKRLLATSLVGLVCFMLYSSLLLPALGVSPGSPREVYSLPFQQTARYLRDHDDDVTPAERDAIAAVLDYDNVVPFYSSDSADSIKTQYNKNATTGDILRYLGAWAEMGLRHPLTYLKAMVLNIHSYFGPMAGGGWVWAEMYVYDDGRETFKPQYEEHGYYFEQKAAVKDLRDTLGYSYGLYADSPLGLLTNMGTVCWCLLFVSVFLLRHVRLRYLVPLIPALLMILVCVVSPKNAVVRYGLPYIVAWPVIAAYVLWCVQFAQSRRRLDQSHKRFAQSRRRKLTQPKVQK